MEERIESYILINPDNLDRLCENNKQIFIQLLEIIDGNGIEEKISTNGNLLKTLPASKIREIVIELKGRNIPNCEIYNDSRLDCASPGSISSYIAHYTMGTYSREREK